MGYNKFIKSGNNLELYEYERECFSKGRPRGYVFNTKGKDLGDVRSAENAERIFKRRKDNAQRSSMAFRRIVLSNLTPIENPLFVAITFRENRTDIPECARFFRLFIQNLRRQYGKGFRYIAVPEFQKRGAVHYHALFWGIENKEFLLSKRLSGRFENISPEWSELHGEGFVFIKDTDGREALSGYMSKYMVKAINDPRLFSTKAYFASRNILRPLINKGFPMWWVEDEYNLNKIDPIVSKRYLTSHLGYGNYKKYLLD